MRRGSLSMYTRRDGVLPAVRHSLLWPASFLWLVRGRAQFSPSCSCCTRWPRCACAGGDHPTARCSARASPPCKDERDDDRNADARSAGKPTRADGGVSVARDAPHGAITRSIAAQRVCTRAFGGARTTRRASSVAIGSFARQTNDDRRRGVSDAIAQRSSSALAQRREHVAERRIRCTRCTRCARRDRARADVDAGRSFTRRRCRSEEDDDGNCDARYRAHRSIRSAAPIDERCTSNAQRRRGSAQHGRTFGARSVGRHDGDASHAAKRRCRSARRKTLCAQNAHGVGAAIVHPTSRGRVRRRDLRRGRRTNRSRRKTRSSGGQTTATAHAPPMVSRARRCGHARGGSHRRRIALARRHPCRRRAQARRCGQRSSSRHMCELPRRHPHDGQGRSVCDHLVRARRSRPTCAASSGRESARGRDRSSLVGA